MTLADAIRKARTAKGWTQVDLAEVIQAGRYTVQNWESGRCMPRADILAGIEDAFGWPRGQTLRFIKGEA